MEQNQDLQAPEPMDISRGSSGSGSGPVPMEISGEISGGSSGTAQMETSEVTSVAATVEMAPSGGPRVHHQVDHFLGHHQLIH
jgi:hypothetical protein